MLPALRLASLLRGAGTQALLQARHHAAALSTTFRCVVACFTLVKPFLLQRLLQLTTSLSLGVKKDAASTHSTQQRRQSSSAVIAAHLNLPTASSGRDDDDQVQRLRGWVEAELAGGELEAAALRSAEAVLAALAEGEEWLKTRVDQQQQQPGGSRACAGCGKTAADEGVVKLRRCTGCPRESALWFCSVACQKAVWVGGHKRECPRLDTAAQRDQ